MPKQKTDQTTSEWFHGNDPAGVTDGALQDEDGDIGPDETIDGVEHIEGESMPAGNGKKKAKKKVSKSASYWNEVVEKVLSGYDIADAINETPDIGDEMADQFEKAFPGTGASHPQMPPFPGAMGAGQPPMMQTPGVQPYSMGQPQMPPQMGMGMGGMQQPGMPQAGGMPQQLPPDVVAYIQQLEQALQQAQGGQDNSDDDGDDDSSGGSDDSDHDNPFGKSGDFEMSDTNFLTELSKSLGNEDAMDAISKAQEMVSKAEARARQAETIAKQERDLRLEREFIAKAAEFNLPMPAEQLGPVLKRAAESLPGEDWQALVKCLRAVSAQNDEIGIYNEIGKRGGADNGSVFDEVEMRAHELLSKSATLSPEGAITSAFESDPRLYDEYMRSHPSRRLG